VTGTSTMTVFYCGVTAVHFPPLTPRSNFTVKPMVGQVAAATHAVHWGHAPSAAPVDKTHVPAEDLFT